MRSCRTILGICMLLAVHIAARAQKGFSIPKVSIADLQRTSYPIDTTAEAIILFDVGHFEGFNFDRNLRVKILKKSGLKWGNWTFNSPSSNTFKVTVYNLEKGQVIAEKATDKSVFEEQVVNQFHVGKVFAPNVKVGSIIDISYRHYDLPFEWRFQELIPVLYNQLTIAESADTYKKTFFGFEKVTSNGPGQWSAVNIPAFKPEPFINSYSNYITKFQFQVESVMNFYRRAGDKSYVELSTTWQKVIELLNKDPKFGGIVNGCGFLNEFAKVTRERMDLNRQQKIEAAIQYVKKNMKWNKQETIFASVDLRNNFLVDHDGSVADVNLILISLLNKMDIKAYPVVLSTRSNGMLVEYSATISKLNFVVGLVLDDKNKMLVDATSPDTRPGMLPPNCLNGKGLVIRKDTVQWEDLNQGFRDIKRQYTALGINEDGTATAKVIRDYEGYGYVTWVDTLKSNNKDSELLKNKITREYPDLRILSYAITVRDSIKGVSQEVIDIDASQQVIEADGEALLNPFPFFEYAANPLREAERKLPLDLWSPRDITSTVAVQLPKGYTLREIPPSEKFSIPDGSASFTYLASANNINNTVQFKIVVKLSKPVYTEIEYQELRQFFSHIVKKVNTPVRLAKT